MLLRHFFLTAVEWVQRPSASPVTAIDLALQQRSHRCAVMLVEAAFFKETTADKGSSSIYKSLSALSSRAREQSLLFEARAGIKGLKGQQREAEQHQSWKQGAVCVLIEAANW